MSQTGPRDSSHPAATPADPWDAIRSLVARPYVVLDTETTGLLNPEIVAVGVVSSSGETVLNELVRPARPIEPEASRITGIDAAAVADKPEFPAIEPALSRAIADSRVCIYNAAYDLAAIENTYARYGLPIPAFEPWCVMEWFAQVHGEWNEARGSYVWQPLAKAARHFGVTQGAPHDALDDALTTWRILDAAIAHAGLRPRGAHVGSHPDEARENGMRSLFDEAG